MTVYIAGVNQPVDTADTYFTEIKKLPISGSKLAKQKLVERLFINKMPVYDAKPLDARIEYARYVVDCPNCGSAEFAFEDKLFFCSSCHNSDINNQVRKVKMPKERSRIEAALGKRKIINRHWNIGESAEKLEKENLKMGVI